MRESLVDEEGSTTQFAHAFPVVVVDGCNNSDSLFEQPSLSLFVPFTHRNLVA